MNAHVRAHMPTYMHVRATGAVPFELNATSGVNAYVAETAIVKKEEPDMLRC